MNQYQISLTSGATTLVKAETYIFTGEPLVHFLVGDETVTSFGISTIEMIKKVG